MSLKALVQLFAEKFLQSKRAWVADQSAFIVGNATELTVIADSEEHVFTMPFTGFVNLRGYGVWFADIGGYNLVNIGPSSNGNLSVYLYAKKGQQLKYALGPSAQFSTAQLNIYRVGGS